MVHLGGSNTHFADFMIGVTDKKPSISGNPNILDGWDPVFSLDRLFKS